MIMLRGLCRKWTGIGVRACRRHPYVLTFVSLLLYLIIFQPGFVFSGDSWAETFYEYVYGAATGGKEAFFHVGIAGYFNFLPKLFSYGYILLGAPMQYVDYFLRIVVILYAVACISFIAHPYNRHLIKNDLLRILLAFATLLTFYHISSFSLINVWYVGFIPIILVSLHPKRFVHEWQEVLYATFAVSVCLTKPSVVVLPLIIYRMVRHREFLLGSIISFAVALQTLLFFTSSYYEQFAGIYNQHIGFFEKIISTLLYPGVLALKLYQINPPSIIVVAASTVLLGGLFLLLIRIRGLLQALLIGLTLCIASYTAIYPPDTPPFSVVSGFAAIFSDEMKLQREVLISFVVIFVLFVASGYLVEKYRPRWANPLLVKTGIVAFLVVLTAMSFRSIDTQSAKLHVNIDPFRSSLAKQSAICMPIPPTPSWYPKGTQVYGWYYESYGLGTCGKTNYDKTIDYGSFNKQLIKNGRAILITNQHDHLLKTIYIPVFNPRPDAASTLVLKNEDTGKTYEAPIESKKTDDHLTYVAFNLDGDEVVRHTYHLTLTEKGTNQSKLSTGTFTDKSIALYSYFLPPGLNRP